VTAADTSDRDGAAQLLRRLDRRRFPRLRHGWADQGYRGAFLNTSASK
jgi:putative transposase